MIALEQDMHDALRLCSQCSELCGSASACLGGIVVHAAVIVSVLVSDSVSRYVSVVE